MKLSLTQSLPRKESNISKSSQENKFNNRKKENITHQGKIQLKLGISNTTKENSGKNISNSTQIKTS
jgi:hypothetical protein